VQRHRHHRERDGDGDQGPDADRDHVRREHRRQHEEAAQAGEHQREPQQLP
jgi:hypothetical protein